MLRLALLSVSLAAALAAAGQNPPYSIQVDVPLVTVDLMVSDADGRPVTELTRSDFVLLEDGQPQEIQAFSPVDSPYSILLVIDRSRSMEAQWPLMEPAITRFLTSLKPQDRVSIGAFDERSQDVELLLDWREVQNGSLIQIPLNPLTRGNPYVVLSGGIGARGGVSQFSVRVPTKDFYRALDWAARRIAGVIGRKGVIVFTDGRQPRAPTRLISVDGVRHSQLVDPKDDADFRQVLLTVQASQTRFDFVAVNTDLNPTGGRFSLEPSFALDHPLFYSMPVRLRLELLASQSGGKVALAKQPEDTVKVYEEIARELGTSYTLAYAPSARSLKDGAHHRIEVRTWREGLRIRQSRDGFSGR